MTTEQIAETFALRGCSIVEDNGRFALVHPTGYEKHARTRDLLATTRTAALTEAWLWLHPESHTRASITTIQEIVMQDFRLPIESLLTGGRPEPLATARRIAMALCRELTGVPLTVIGAAFNRDHGTVIHAQDSVRDQCTVDRAFAARVGTLRVACSAAMRPDGE